MTYLEPLIDLAITAVAVAAFVLWLKWQIAKESAAYWKQAALTYENGWQEVERLQRIIRYLSSRIAAQSELLSQRAEKQPDEGSK